MHHSPDWRDHLSSKYKQFLKSVEDDHGKVLSKTLMLAYFHHHAEIRLKQIAHPSDHPAIERTFGFNVGLIPGNRYHDAKKAADSIAWPLMNSIDTYLAQPAQRSAEWVEKQFINYENKFEEWLNPPPKPRR